MHNVLNKLFKSDFESRFTDVLFATIIIESILDRVLNSHRRIVEDRFIGHLHSSLHEISENSRHPAVGNLGRACRG